MLSQTDANPPCQNTPLPVYNHRTGTRSPTGLLQTRQQTHRAHSGKMLLPGAALTEPSLTWWPPQSGDPALCHTGAVRDRGGVCRTTSLTHGVREGGPDTSGRKTARGNTDRRMQSDGDWATRMSVRLTPYPGVTRETPLTPLGVTRERLDPPDVSAPKGAPGGWGRGRGSRCRARRLVE